MTDRSPPDRRRTAPDRRLATDGRGVSEIIGAILMFGLVLILLVVVQATAVPMWNQDTEFEHSQRVQADWQEFDAAAAAVAADGTERTVVVETGVRYPSRPFLINPPPAGGSIETLPPGTIIVENAAVDDTNGYWTGTQTYQTRALQYDPDYREYHNGPTTVYENGILHNQYPGATIMLDDGSVVDGRNVNLDVLEGEYAAARAGPTSLDIEATSAPSRTVQMQDTGAPIRITVPTRLDAETLTEEVFADECDEPGCVNVAGDARSGRYVQSVTVTEGSPYNTAVITLETGTSYSMTMSAVTVGNGDRTDAAYLTREGPENLLVGAPSETDLTVAVFDRYNNPVAGETVTFKLSTGSQGDFGADGTTTTVRTGQDGRATATYESPGVNTTGNVVTASIDGATAAPKATSWTIETNTEVGVGGPGGAGPEDAVSSVNPGQNTQVPYINGVDVGGGNVELCFANDASRSWTFSEMRISLYFASGGSPTSAVVSSPAGTGDSELDIGGEYNTTAGSVGSINAGGDLPVTLNFGGGSGSGNQFFILSVQFTDSGELRTLSYIVSVTDSGTCP